MKWIFLFNGWGMDQSAFSHLNLEHVEVIDYPYEIESLLEKHKEDELYAIAWSFGAYYFAKLPEDIQKRFTKKVAINGLPETLGPYGIMPKMCQFTLDNLTEESLKAFYENMNFYGNVNKSFEKIKKELAVFVENYQVQKNCFDFAWIGEEDRIFSAKKLKKYYEKEGVPYAIFPAGHYPFSHFQNLLELVGVNEHEI